MIGISTGIGIRTNLKILTEERLKEEIAHVEKYLLIYPEPEIIRGRSYVRRWGEECQRELDSRGK